MRVPSRHGADRRAGGDGVPDLGVKPVKPGQHNMGSPPAIDDQQAAEAAERAGISHPATAGCDHPGTGGRLIGDASGRAGIGRVAEMADDRASDRGHKRLGGRDPVGLARFGAFAAVARGLNPGDRGVNGFGVGGIKRDLPGSRGSFILGC